MDSSFPVEKGPPQLTLQQLMEEFVSQRVRLWKARQVKVPDSALAANIAAMCWDYDSLPPLGPGCLLPDPKGGYVYVPYNESREGLAAELQQRLDILDRWLLNPANAKVLLQLDKILEKEIDEKCFWEFLDGGCAARLDFHGKIKVLAKYRLMEKGVDVSPNDPRIPQFRFGITDVTEFGNVKMKWHYLNWNCTEGDVMRCLGNFSRPIPLFSPEDTRARLLKDLETIHHPEDAAKEAQALAEELKLKGEQPPVENEPDWMYFLCGPDEASVPLEARTWLPLRRAPNGFKAMKRMSREHGKWAIIIRPWQLRHYKLCFRVHQLQVRQLKYSQEVEKNAALPALDKEGKPYFNENEG